MVSQAHEKMEIHLDLDQKSYSYPCRSTMAQFVATLCVGLTYFGLGVLFMMPTVIVGNLLNVKNDALSLNEEEGSWLGGLPFLVMPIGALLGIILQDFFGQRYGLLVSNVTGLVSLVIMYNAKSFTALMISTSMIGISLGFMEPSGMSYVSEYSEPKVRGLFCSATVFLAGLGIFFESLVVAIVEWRTGTLICSAIPILSIIVLLLVPDSPSWLLSNGKQKRALKALSWFRGWVREEDVAEEFEDMCVYVRKSFAYSEYHTPEERLDLTDTSISAHDVKQLALLDLLMSLFEKRTLHPFFLLCVFAIISTIASSFGATMYVINLFDALHIPVDRDWAALAYGGAMSAGNFSLTFMLKCVGKRKVGIFGTIAASLTSITLGAYVHFRDRIQMPWLFIVLIFLQNFVSAHSRVVPFLMMGEVFSVKNRHVACGFMGAAFDVIMFIFIKTYFTLDGWLGTAMYFIASGLVGIVGSLCLYFVLPETEGKSLAEIDRIFVAKSFTCL